jgi:hypothetical protein
MPWFSVQAGIGDKMHFQCSTNTDATTTWQRSTAVRIFDRIKGGGCPRNANLTGDTGNAFTGPAFKPTWVRVLINGNKQVPDLAHGDCPTDLDLYWTNLGDSL